MTSSFLRRVALRLRRLRRVFAPSVRERDLFQASPVASALVDARGMLVEVNRSWERLTGRRGADVVGRAAFEFGLPEGAADVDDHAGRLVHADGRRIEVRVSTRGLGEKGRRCRICTWRDATEQQRAEQALHELGEANRELESYNYCLSHDLRQPLAAISGFADLLLEQEETLDSLAHTCAREIEANAERMNQIIESLRRLADSGRAALRLTTVDVGDQVAAVLQELSIVVPPNGVIEVGELPPVQADPVLLRQVWMNLIDNALKYSRDSDVPRVQIRGERRSGAVEYTVRDNGVGFDMRDAGRLFSAFQRLASAADFEGHGIGLAIVQRVVRRHGGTIVAESEPGKGAMFRLTLPDREAA